MYINSRLRSRYGEQAVYKCFMDVWRKGSVIHDVWQEHFECGFWIGDYNGLKRNSSGIKIINCRIRNNFADGVNFCQCLHLPNIHARAPIEHDWQRGKLSRTLGKTHILVVGQSAAEHEPCR